MSKLSKSFIDKLPLPKPTSEGKATQSFYRDSSQPGFGLRVGSGGTKTFFVETRINGRLKRITVGRYGNLTPEQARKEAVRLLGEISLGNDPQAEKQEKRAKTITFGRAFEDYLISRKDLKPGTVKNYRKCVDGCLDDWKTKRLIDITKDMVEKRHNDLGKRAPARANNTMRVLRAIFNYSIEVYEDKNGKPILQFNPADRLSSAKSWYRVERRQTILKPHQIKSWWQATEQLNNESSRDYLRFLLLTGLRKMEAATLSWDMIDFKDQSFSISDTKNRDLHQLPLTPFLVNLLQERKSRSTSKWVFTGRYEDVHIKEPRVSIKRVAVLSEHPFTLHDLRRTFITIAESLDIPAYALKKLINHRDPNDVTAGYIISGVDRLRLPMTLVNEQLLEFAGKRND